MTQRSDALIAAQARYEVKRARRPTVVWRMTEAQALWLAKRQRPSESRAAAVARLLGVGDS